MSIGMFEATQLNYCCIVGGKISCLLMVAADELFLHCPVYGLGVYLRVVLDHTPLHVLGLKAVHWVCEFVLSAC